MEKNNVWMVSDNTFSQVESDFKVEQSLPTGIYNIELTMFGWKLYKFASKFEFPFKIYNLEDNFIEHVLTTYKHTAGNFGVLLNGTKGTGKTITAKQLANALQLPIIIVKDMGDKNQAMIEFLSTIECDCILFFDEFEKNFSEKDSTILQIMDGVYNSVYRKIFLLTTNAMNINENLTGRPSRIRYVKHFGNLSIDVVNMYLDDTLEDSNCKPELLAFIDSLVISTIDILKAIVAEVNIHGIENFRIAKSFFNVQTNHYSYFVNYGYVHCCEYHNSPEKFSIDKFLVAVEHHNNPIPKPIVNDENNCTEEERKALNNFYEYNKHDFHYISSSIIDSDIKFQALEVGDLWDSEKIIAINKKKNIVVTEYDAEYKFYFIKDPNSKPCLYSKQNLIM